MNTVQKPQKKTKTRRQLSGSVNGNLPGNSFWFFALRLDFLIGASQTKRMTVIRKELAETQEYGTCLAKDMEVDSDKSLEEVGFVPSGVARTPEGQAHVRQEMQQKKLQVF